MEIGLNHAGGIRMGRVAQGPAIGAAVLFMGGALAAKASPAPAGIRLERTATTVPVGTAVSLKAVAVNGTGEVVPGLSTRGVHWSDNAGGSARLSARTGADTTFSASRPGRYRIAATLDQLRRTLVIRVVPALPKRSIPVTDLVLRAPSAHLAGLIGFRDWVPTGMPAETAIRYTAVPLYPGAHPVAAPVDHYPAPYSGSWYLLAAPVRAFEVDASRAAVDQWYRSAFAMLGYQPDGQGGGGATRLYAFSRNPRDPDAETVGIQTTAVAQGTRVVYGASAVAVPARPAASLLPAGARALRVTYWSGTGSAPVRFTLTSGGVLSQLVEALNAIPLAETQTQTACALPYRGQGIQITVAKPRRVSPTVSLWELCGGDMIGHAEVNPSPTFWFLVQLLAKGYGR